MFIFLLYSLIPIVIIFKFLAVYIDHHTDVNVKLIMVDLRIRRFTKAPVGNKSFLFIKEYCTVHTCASFLSI